MPKPTAKKIAPDKKIIQEIWEHPHRLGWILGYDRLGPIHSDWIKYLYLSTEERRILAHRDSYKTTACIIVGSIWFIFFFPNNRILNTSATPKKVLGISNEIRAAYRNKNLLELYNLIGVKNPRDEDFWRTDSIALTTRSGIFKGMPSMDFISTNSELTGEHYTHINCDDIVTMKDKLSEAERKYKEFWYQNLQSIISDTQGGHIAMIGTLWHPKDLYSKDKEELARTPKYPALSMKISGFNKKKLESKENKQTPAFYAAQYKLKHISDETMIFDNPKIIPIRDFPKDMKLISYVDPAFGGKYACGMTVGGIYNDIFYIKYGWAWFKTLSEIYNLVFKGYALSKARVLYIENNAGQKSFLDVLRRKGLFPIGINNSVNKYVRIESNVQRNWPKIIFSDKVKDSYLEQIVYYQEPADFGQKPKDPIDALDSLAGLIDKLDPKSIVEDNMGLL